MENALLKISEVSEFFGISVKAMRLYEKMGLIVPVKKDPSTGYRYYAPEQVMSLNILIALKAIGFSLTEIKGVMKGSVNIPHLMDLLLLKSRAWRESAKFADSKINQIDDMVNKIDESRPPFQLNALTDEQRAWLLSKMTLIETASGRRVLSEALWL